MRALQRGRATMDDIGVVLRLLLVCYQAMRESGATWPQISEDVQEYNLGRIAQRMRESEGLPAGEQPALIDKTIRAHPEKVLLACGMEACGMEAINNTPLPADDETARRMMLVARNLVGCLAQPTRPTPKRKR